MPESLEGQRLVVDPTEYPELEGKASGDAVSLTVSGVVEEATPEQVSIRLTGEPAGPEPEEVPAGPEALPGEEIEPRTGGGSEAMRRLLGGTAE